MPYFISIVLALNQTNQHVNESLTLERVERKISSSPQIKLISLLSNLSLAKSTRKKKLKENYKLRTLKKRKPLDFQLENSKDRGPDATNWTTRK